MHPNLLTNTLLAIIAVLLLVQVIQTGMNQPRSLPRPMIQNPHISENAPMPMNGGGDMVAQQAPPQNMILMALKAFPAGCEGKMVLADCSSSAAEEVKTRIEKFQSSGKGIRQTFDFIVSTWGEQVLTEQALQIRNMRKKSQ